MVRPDGTDRQCVTCAPEAPAKHNGSVALHPGGRFFVFAAENEDVQSRKRDRLAIPGFGLNTNLWAATADGKQFWQLTVEKTDAEHPRGVISPRFSPDGKRLFWAGPVEREQVRKGRETGEWALFFADVDVHTGVPVPSNVRRLPPGDQHLTWLRDIKTELRAMARDGSGAHRPTGFDRTFDRDSRWFHRQLFAAGRIVVTDNAWSPDGTRAAVGYETHSGLLNAVLAIVDLQSRLPTPSAAGALPIRPHRIRPGTCDRDLRQTSPAQSTRSRPDARPGR